MQILRMWYSNDGNDDYIDNDGGVVMVAVVMTVVVVTLVTQAINTTETFDNFLLAHWDNLYPQEMYKNWE